MSTGESPQFVRASEHVSGEANASGEVLDAETAARRSLGIAMNSVWGGTEVSSLPTLPAQIAADAQALLRERVPAGRERELAIDLLEQAVHDVHPH